MQDAGGCRRVQEDARQRGCRGVQRDAGGCREDAGKVQEGCRREMQGGCRRDAGEMQEAEQGWLQVSPGTVCLYQ